MTGTISLPVHPAAAVWPMLPDDELQALADDIKANGLIHPIVLTPDGEILDGRCRLAACERAKVKPSYVTHDGDPVAYVLGANAHRRHVTKGQKAMATVLTARSVVNNSPPSQRKLAAEVRVDHGMISWAQTVAEHASTLIDRVMAPVEPMPLRVAYDEAVKLRELTTSTDARLAKLAKEAPDLAQLVRSEAISLVGAEADLAERRKQRALIGKQGEHAALDINGMSLGNALAVYGAVEAGFDLDAKEAINSLRKAADTLESLLTKLDER